MVALLNTGTPDVLVLKQKDSDNATTMLNNDDASLIDMILLIDPLNLAMTRHLSPSLNAIFGANCDSSSLF